MKRALLGVVLLAACGACSRGGGGPSFDVIVHVDSARDGSGADERFDRDVIQPLERAIAASGLPMTTRGRVYDGRGTIVVTPAAAADADVGKVTAELHRLLEQVDRRTLDDDPSIMLRTLPEADALFVFSAPGYLPQSVDALAQVPGVRALDSCGLRQETPVIYADPQRMAARGVSIAQLADAASQSGSGSGSGNGDPGDLADLGDLKHHLVGSHATRIDDVALVAATGERTCAALWGAAGATAVLEVRGFGADRAKLAEVAASGKYRDPWEAAHVPPEQRGELYTSRVRYEAADPATGAATEQLIASVTAARGVAWAIGELDLAQGTVRIVVGMTASARPEQAADAVARSVAVPRVRAVVDALGGAIEVEAVLGSDEAAAAVLAALRKAHVDAGCDGCRELSRPEVRYVADPARAAELQVAPAEIARVIAALQPGGLELPGERHLEILHLSPGPVDLSGIYLTGAQGARIPVSAVARMEEITVYPRLSENGKPVVTVWVRADSAEAARAALAAAVPSGTVIRTRVPAL